MVDPWFSGSIFNHSWKLLEDTDPGSLDLSRLRYLWISHEHPDHFNLPTLQTIRKLCGDRPFTVFFQDMPDKSVRNVLGKMGFEVCEMSDGRRYKAGSMEMTCFRNGGDSTLILESGGQLVLNTNDCGLEQSTIARIARHLDGRRPDYLFSQFGIAGHSANPDEPDLLRAAHDRQLGQIISYIQRFKPRTVVPFASYVYFSRTVNRYLNDSQVRVSELLGRDLGDTILLVPKPLDRITPALAANSAENACYWDAALGREREWPAETQVDAATLTTWGGKFMATLKTSLFRRRAFDESAVFIPDLNSWAIFDWKNFKFSVSPVHTTPVAADIASSDLLFFLKFPWGSDTLNISAAFRVRDRQLWADLAYSKHFVYAIEKANRAARFKNRVLVTARSVLSRVGVDLSARDSTAWKALRLLRLRGMTPDS